MSNENEPEQWMNIADAQAYLGVGGKKMAALLKDGTLPYRPSKLDRRSKLVKRSDVVALKAQEAKKAAA